MQPADERENPLPWLARAFALNGVLLDGAEPTVAARGMMGRVWRLPTSTGFLAAKELFWEAPSPQDAAIEVQFAVDCRRVGVPSPAAIAGADGSFVQADPVTGLGWRLYEWVDGRVPEPYDLTTACWLATVLARMHRLDRPAAADVDAFYRLVDADWAALSAAAVAAQPASSADLARLVPTLVELSGRVNAAPAESAIYTHRDVNNSNALIDPRGGRWLLDWDNCGAMVPARELGRLLLDAIRDPDGVQQIAAAYRAADGPANTADRYILSSGLAIWLNVVAEQFVYLLEPGDTETASGAAHLANAELVVRKLLAAMPDPGLVDHTLQLLRS